MENSNGTKYTPENIEKIIALIKQGNFTKVACEAVGVSRSTFYSWLKTYPDFKKRVETAKAIRIATLIQDIRKNDSWQSKAWMLERLDSKSYHLATSTEKDLKERVEKLEEVLEQYRMKLPN